MLDEASLRLIEAHHGIRRAHSAALIGLASDQPAVLEPVGSFDIQRMWFRGRFARSLFAPSGLESDQWRARNEDELLPLGGDLPGHSPLAPHPWRWFAIENGHEETGLLKRSRLRRDTFDRLRDVGEQRDLIFRLAPWSPPGEPSPWPDFIYLTDSGILHHLLGLPEAELNDWQRRSLRYRDAVWDRRRELSWEGFAISCLVRAVGARGRASYWTAPDGEIDLILEWSQSRECWAIEITLGRSKRIKSHFERGCGEVQATRAILLHNSLVGAPKIKWDRDMARNLEIMTLEEALLAVDAGP